MAFPNPHVYPPDQQITSAYCKALGYPARLQILELLNEHRKMYVHELCRELPLQQGAVSEHLRKLRQAGLIEVEVHGLRNAYYVNRQALHRAQDCVNGFLRKLGGKGVERS